MDESELQHNITFSHFTQTGKDDFGQPVRTSVSATEKCFFDLPRKSKTIKSDSGEISVEAVLYMKKDSTISVDDTVDSVTDADGTSLSSISLRVARVTRASDFGTIDHLEVDLKKA